MKQRDTKQEAAELIASAMREALKTLASEKLDAKRLLSSEAESARQLLETRNSDGSSDHDTQIKLVEAVATLDKKFTEKFADLKADIKGLSDGISNRIALLEQEKLNTRDSYSVLYKEVVEKRLESLETKIATQGTIITKIWSYGIAVLFVLGVLEFLINKFV